MSTIEDVTLDTCLLHHALLTATSLTAFATGTLRRTSFALNLRLFQIVLQSDLVLAIVHLGGVTHGAVHRISTCTHASVSTEVVLTSMLAKHRVSLDTELRSVVIERLKFTLAWRHIHHVRGVPVLNEFLLVSHSVAANVEIGHLPIHLWAIGHVLSCCSAEMG